MLAGPSVWFLMHWICTSYKLSLSSLGHRRLEFLLPGSLSPGLLMATNLDGVWKKPYPSWTLRWLWLQLTLCLCPCQRPWAGQSSWGTSGLSQRLWENTQCCKPGTLALFPVLCSKVGFFNLWGCLRVWLYISSLFDNSDTSGVCPWPRDSLQQPDEGVTTRTCMMFNHMFLLSHVE